MIEKRYFLHKHLRRDVIHDTLCHQWLKGEELEEHMNVQYTKYSGIKKENEQLKSRIKELEIMNEAQSDAIDGLQETMCHLDLSELNGDDGND